MIRFIIAFEQGLNQNSFHLQTYLIRAPTLSRAKVNAMHFAANDDVTNDIVHRTTFMILLFQAKKILAARFHLRIAHHPIGQIR